MTDPTVPRYPPDSAGEYLETHGPRGFFHVCNGPRPGGHFLQSTAWEAYIIARNSTSRAVARTLDDSTGNNTATQNDDRH